MMADHGNFPFHQMVKGQMVNEISLESFQKIQKLLNFWSATQLT